ncbi:TcmI family type II polyketide cyclase [Streptomyces ipomoeae]|uniref:Polyketide synthesis cyclase n=2 Tax=Streptomyces ipomoeae TaxID=103232 RepID=L1KIR8_9ACTN|nr:TcmI family type II polyketide cyclase [Streptomyces ipomoeae]EKX60716.1 polyketide synthesis cyclase [Streptomyces ipomoeae 91-03]MDX2693208.1 TcmI family type II polyketide cyclase [Streptomyces ipomoeae]MDX2820651.1 TcmI family type II polyketide cyclase [Streptomyces ipomoeae]MDX2838680.1 TcmI family type II polyketide cyclase [Streptomyces ipomoeae]MDX2873159.1 TcmI family type II polyketide cyclase [Streptomyces ipomoeae]
MNRTLIVARMQQQSAPEIAQIFAESDASELPHLIGVSRRTLFTFHDVYVHLIEADENFRPNLSRARNHPLFQDVDARLSEFISPYDPGWQEPKDAMARAFYEWTADQGRIR